MDAVQLRRLLAAVKRGGVDVDEAARRLAGLSTEDLGFAKLDHQRAVRRGQPEVVFGQGKAKTHLLTIVERFARRGAPTLVTRLEPALGEELLARWPAGRWNEVGRAFFLPGLGRRPRPRPGLLVVSAGTADLAVAEEAAATAEALGLAPDRLYDAGVAGLHRLLEQGERLRRARVVIVVAGMEGALPSVVAGLIAAPVIAVPTSVGYGAALHGFTALLGMLTSCAAGVTVVNIDNGYGAAAAAHLILSASRRG
ncbi:MAG TPA: nickel pincer cofactor biosynthesis protein LarB [Acidobacteriota bacterium]|nr:nickel pincer cofactor biosynthesis protein LarB [Acidobacteriota bacterium]